MRLVFRMARGLVGAPADTIIARRGTGYRSVDDLWRRAGVPVTALERLAEADAFQCFGLDRRQAVWAIRGLAPAPLPLFAAAEEAREPAVTLTAMTDGRQVVEDYRSVGLSLGQHPVAIQAGLEAEVISRQRLDRGQPRGLQCHLDAPALACGVFLPEQGLDGLQRRHLALLDARQRHLQGFERPGHLEAHQVTPDAIGGVARHNGRAHRAAPAGAATRTAAPSRWATAS